MLLLLLSMLFDEIVVVDAGVGDDVGGAGHTVGGDHGEGVTGRTERSTHQDHPGGAGGGRIRPATIDRCKQMLVVVVVVDTTIRTR